MQLHRIAAAAIPCRQLSSFFFLKKKFHDFWPEFGRRTARRCVVRRASRKPTSSRGNRLTFVLFWRAHKNACILWVPTGALTLRVTRTLDRYQVPADPPTKHSTVFDHRSSEITLSLLPELRPVILQENLLSHSLLTGTRSRMPYC